MIGESVARASRADDDRRSLLLTASVVASNFPDADLVFTKLAPAPLGYLLHHRGHTHTLGGALLQLGLVFALMFAFPKFRRALADRRTKLATLFAIAAGLFGHLLLDSWNSYGVHPFWPLDPGWRYGDAIFIIEPVLWIGMILPLLPGVRSRGLRLFLVVVGFGVPLLAWERGLLAGFSIALLAVLAVAIRAFMTVFRSAGARLALGFGIVFADVGLQFAMSGVARARAESELAAGHPGARRVAVIAEPVPANPFCWRIYGISLEGGVVRAESRDLSLWPSFLPPSACVSIRPPRAVEYRLGELEEARERDCRLDAWLRFARVPALAGDRAEDLRFADGEVNFTTMEVSASPRDCPAFIPEWGRPRQDLIDAANSVGD